MDRFEVKVAESDLLVVMSPSNIDSKRVALEAIEEVRGIVEQHIKERPTFLTSLNPLSYMGHDPILKRMYKAAEGAGVGPMAAIAGMTSEYVGKRLEQVCGDVEVFVENGGDLYLKAKGPRTIAIHAGKSSLSDQLKLLIKPEAMPLGICTSAGTIGHSLSMGRADAAVVLSQDTALADAVATQMGNLVQSDKDIKVALEYALAVEGVLGAVVIIGDHMGAMGQVTFAP